VTLVSPTCGFTLVTRWACALTLVACGGQTVPHEMGTNHNVDAGEDASEQDALCEAETWGEAGGLFAEWRATPNTHSHLPNVSYAGYRYGAALPDLSTLRRVRVIDYGAVPGSTDDASDAIAAALADIATTGGVVEFPEGELRVRRPIAVQSDDTVLVGAGSDKSRILFDQALDDAYARNTRDSSSRWSWTGGLVWFAPASLRSFPAPSSELGGTWNEGWVVTGNPISLAQPARRGDTHVEVVDATAFQPGDRVVVEVDSNMALLAHLAGEGDYARSVDWTQATYILPPQQAVVHWPVEIVAVHADNTLELAQPLRFALRDDWKPRVRRLGPVLRDSGIVGLTLRLGRITAYDTARDHHHESGWNGLMMENAWDCFAQDVRVENAENALLFTASKNITVRDFTITSTSDALALQHHGTVTRQFCNDILFSDFTIESEPIHGINVEGFSMGNVWSRGTLSHGTWDVHRTMPLENAITELVVHNDGSPGGPPNSGPRMGARQVAWNIVVDNNDCGVIGEPRMMPSGVIEGVRGCEPGTLGNSDAIVQHSGLRGTTPDPPNLYEAQRALRMCRER